MPKKYTSEENPKLAEKIKKAEEELEIDELKAFEETMYGDIWQKEDYLNWMYENLITIKNIMSDEASIYVHLDQTIGHYVKILLDEVFGEHHFVNEVIWKYVKFQMGKMTRFAKNTDRIFLYSKSEERVFNSLREQLDEPKKLLKKGWDKEKGSIQNIKDENGKTQKIEVFDEKVDDLWNIPFIGATSGEREDYATQKPEKLLSRVIESCSNKEMLVADFFGGSGVTAKVANDLGRKFIHVDIGLNSIQTTRDRLVEAGASFQILEIKDGVSLFRNPQQTMDKLAKLIPGLQQKVSGVGKFWFGALQDSKLGTVPVYVPNLIDGSEKVLDIPAVNRIINEELQKLEIIAQKAIVYYVDVDDRKALEKFIKDNNATQTTIELKDLKEILHAIVVEDEVEIKTTKTEEGFEVEIIKLVSDRLNQKINDFNEKGNLQAINKGKKFSPITISEEGLELIEYLSLDCENAEGVWTSSSEIKIDKLGFISINGQKTKDFWNGKISADKKPLRLKIRNISGDETIKVFE
jgi:adenine-specific DNA-methyltransferase